MAGAGSRDDFPLGRILGVGVAVFLIAVGGLLFSSRDRFRRPVPETPEAYRKRQVEWMMGRYEKALSNAGTDLPSFVFVHPLDLTRDRGFPIRIWEPSADMRKGRSDRELVHTLRERGWLDRWNGPYLIRPQWDVTIDPWRRRYRMFWFACADPGRPDDVERRLIPAGAPGAMVVISGGPDGLLQSCARDKSSPAAAAATAPPVEEARQADFARFDPFDPDVAEPDPYRVLGVPVGVGRLDARARVR